MGHNPGQRRSGDSTSALYITKYRPENRSALITVTAATPLQFVAHPDERFVRVDADEPVLVEFSKIDLSLYAITDQSNYVFGEDLVVGETVTGAISGATATVESWVPAGVGNPGSVLSLSNVSPAPGVDGGPFLDGEVVTGGTSGFSVVVGLFREGGTAEPVDPGPGSLRVDQYGFEWLQLGPHAMIRVRAESADADMSLVWGSCDPEDGP